MKIRLGYVSNSSSSSFMAILVDDDQVAEKAFRKIFQTSLENVEYFDDIKQLRQIGFGTYSHPTTGLTFFLSEGEHPADVKIGVNIFPGDIEDVGIRFWKRKLVESLQDLGITIDEDDMRFEYGEWYGS